MPYPNEHAARVLSPSSCTEEYGRQSIGGGVSRIACRLKSNPTKWATQAYRFNKKNFTASEARQWLKDHDVKFTLFEPASEG